MPVETDQLVKRLDGVAEETVGGWTFWRGTIDLYPVIVSRTMKGVASAAAATAIAIERYHPAAVVNQGTAGGHDPGLHVYDIVLGASSVSLGAFKTADRPRGRGSNPLEWTPMDLLASAGSASTDPAAGTMRRFQANAELLAAAEAARPQHRKGRVVTGVIGSSDVWNSEIDRIEHLRREHQPSAEEMEMAAAAQVAGQFQIPFLGVRVLSNNITNGGTYDARGRSLPGVRVSGGEGVHREITGATVTMVSTRGEWQPHDAPHRGRRHPRRPVHPGGSAPRGTSGRRVRR